MGLRISYLSKVKSDKPYYSDRIFWDVNPEQIDFKKNRPFVIVRVFERGDVEDIRACRRFYSEEEIKDTLLKTKFLSRLRLALASAIIDEPEESFRCYTLRQSNKELLPY
jgi:hypothetical protein